ncbi:MAG: PKD domain-containing protein, partial [Chitinophagaceae bacterium]
MKKFALVIVVLISFCNSFGQDFSNKGTDFWVGYGYHVSYVGNTQDMVLYFAIGTEVTNIKVEIPGVGYVMNYNNLAPNTIFESQPIPKTGTQDARLPGEGIYNRGIHITATKPVVAYSHIYNSNVSAASLLFPTNTLGKEYYSINYTQRSNQANSNGFFFVVATDTGTTSVEITPSATTIGGQVAGTPFTVNLTQGQVYNVMGTLTGLTGVDLTGSKVRSISSGNGSCKKIAVFSGSGKLNINCGANQGTSADNFIQQAFPRSAWGKKYLTVPTAQLPNNFFRICVANPLTNVTVNGLPISGLINNFYYDIPVSNTPNRIEADQPIMVAQYITTAALNINNPTCGNRHTTNSGWGDPEMIYLSSVEQTIDKITLNSTNRFNILDHWINIVIKIAAINSVRLDGVPVSGWQTHNQDPGYAYAQVNVNAGAHTLLADSGFNAIAYGYGPAESYGYNAGTNIRDLFNFISPLNPLNISGTNTACSGTPFVFSITYPFMPTSLFWNFYGFQTPNVTQPNPVFDSTYLINGKQVWRYKLPGLYTYPVGNFPVSITAGTSGSDGCGNLQVKDDTLYVFPQPNATIGLVHSGCVSDSAYFKDSTIFTNGNYAYRWYWDFGDGSTSTIKNPAHRYIAPGNYTVKLSLVTNVGCFGDTVSRQVLISNPPTANYGISFPRCVGQPINFTDSSFAAGSGTLTKWFWDFGDGIRDTVTANPNRTHIYTSPGTYTVTLKVESAGGCQSLFASNQVTIGAFPFADYSLTAACLPNGMTQFTNLSTITDGTQASLIYLWDFGEPSSGAANSSALKDPQHAYSTVGPFNVKLTVTSTRGCVKDSTKILNQVFAQPTAAFNVNPEFCLNQPSVFTDQSNGQGNTLTEWHWDFGDGQTSTIQNPTHTYATAGSFTIKLYVKNDKGCFSDTLAKQVIINPLPIAQFTSTTPGCRNKAVTFTNASTTAAGSITMWKWNMGDGNNFILANGNPFTYTYAATGTYFVTLSVETNKAC